MRRACSSEVSVGERPFGFVGSLAVPRGRRRLAVEAEALGLEVFDTDVVSVGDAVVERIRAEGVDVAFECVGSEETMGVALAVTRKGGRAVVVGNAPESVRIDGLALQRGDRSLVGVLMYDRRDLVEAMRLLAGGLLDALHEEDVIEAYTLDEVGAAFAAAKEGRLSAVRAVVRP